MGRITDQEDARQRPDASLTGRFDDGWKGGQGGREKFLFTLDRLEDRCYGERMIEESAEQSTIVVNPDIVTVHFCSLLETVVSDASRVDPGNGATTETRTWTPRELSQCRQQVVAWQAILERHQMLLEFFKLLPDNVNPQRFAGRSAGRFDKTAKQDDLPRSDFYPPVGRLSSDDQSHGYMARKELTPL
ncbi:hypothetical protein WN55_06374 [Dufourea novaeangliae]|uniref:Uncharacterized protein n=1 Tax=Dufourea novaeangliae TaxID=178035 RepID=A0A154PQI3_DUFNO|nr:hypothetical protein WN55_06374 [Dufourea novaeangliae]